MKVLAALIILLLDNIAYASASSAPYKPSDGLSDTSSDSSACTNNSPRSITSFTKREETYLQYQELFTGITSESIRDDIITQLMRFRKRELPSQILKNAIKEFMDLERFCTVNHDMHIDNPAKNSKSYRTLMIVTSLVNFFIKWHEGEIQRSDPLTDIYVQLEDDINSGLVRTFFVARTCDLLTSVGRNDFFLPPLQLKYVTDKAREALILGYPTERPKLPPILGAR